MTDDPKSTLQATVEASVRKTRTVKVDEGARAASVVQRAVEADPVLRNELGQEPWYQSGVGVFGAGGMLWAVGVVLTQIGTNGLNFEAYDFMVMITALGTLISTAGVLYRRFVPGLRPMFHGWLGE